MFVTSATRSTGLRGELRDRAIVIEAHHRGEALSRDVGRVAGRRSGSSCWPGCRRRASSRRRRRWAFSALPCGLKMPPLASSRSPRSMPFVRGRAPTSSATFTPSKATFGSSVISTAGEQRKGAVVELHRGALSGPHRLRDLQQAQLTSRVGPKHLTAGDAEQERVADLAGGAGDGDSYGFAHVFISWVRSVVWNKVGAAIVRPPLANTIAPRHPVVGVPLDGLSRGPLGHRPPQVLVDRAKELLRGLPRLVRARRAARGPWSSCRFRRSRTHTRSSVCAKRVTSGVLVHPPARGEAARPREDRGDRVGGRRLALLVRSGSGG